MERTLSDPQYTYRFDIIDAWDPGEFPMARLAEYMAEIARLFGQDEHVHFEHLEPGSTVLVQRIDQNAVAEVQQRLSIAGDAHAPEDIAKPYRAIERRLAEDGATASLRETNGTEILFFPGPERTQPPTIGPFRQDGVFDGTLIRVGGKDETVPVHLLDGNVTHNCNATREMAQRLALHLFSGTVRVVGNGRWKRNEEGQWILMRFDIKDFEVLDDRPLPEVVQQLREIPGSGWRHIDNPLAELQRLREEAENSH